MGNGVQIVRSTQLSYRICFGGIIERADGVRNNRNRIVSPVVFTLHTKACRYNSCHHNREHARNTSVRHHFAMNTDLNHALVFSFPLQIGVRIYTTSYK